ncbi:MAG: hypothetical protein Q9212_001165 [Teloschistes hypoglaucus]
MLSGVRSNVKNPEFCRPLTTDQNPHGFTHPPHRPSTTLQRPSTNAADQVPPRIPSVHHVARPREEDEDEDTTLEAGVTYLGASGKARPPAKNTAGLSTVADSLNRSPEGSDEFVSLARWERSPIGNPQSPTLESFYNLCEWTRSFAQLYNGQIQDIPPPVIHPDSIIDMLSREREHLVLSWKLLHSPRPRARSYSLWQHIMLWALQHDVDKALIFLDATISEPEGSIPARRYAVEDTFKYIISFYSQRKSADPNTWTKLRSLFCSFIAQSQRPLGHISPMSQKIIYYLLQHSDDTQTQGLYETLSNLKIDLLPNTLAHFMDAFARIGRPDLAMDALRKTVASPHPFILPVVQSSCITLLRTRFDAVEWYRIQSHLATEIIELGIRPEIEMLNAMILNAVEASDYHTAQAIFETARTHGLRRDTITYSTLLKIAFLNLDEGLVERIMYTAEEDWALPRNNRLVSCLVATLMRIGRSKFASTVPSGSGYKAMLRVYERYCDIGPLQELGIYIQSNHVVETAGEISAPSSQLVSIMIMGYIFLSSRLQDVVNLYHRYERHIAKNHHIIAPTAATDHVANAFLLFLGRHKSTYTMSLAILRNMLESPVSVVAKPTVQSWSIIIDSFYRNRQPTAARQIIAMMRENGVEPNKTTWDHIISGHAGMQDALAAAKALREMEKAHFEVDSYTLKAATLVKDRTQLLDALRRTAVLDDDVDITEQESAPLTAYESSTIDAIEHRDGLVMWQTPLRPPVQQAVSPAEVIHERGQDAKGERSTKGGSQNCVDKPGHAVYDDRDFLGPHDKPFSNPGSLEPVYPVRPKVDDKSIDGSGARETPADPTILLAPALWRSKAGLQTPFLSS